MTGYHNRQLFAKHYTSYRDIARRVGLSKDTVGRRIEVLRRAGVVVHQFGHSASRFEIRDYLLRLDVVGIELDVAGRRP